MKFDVVIPIDGFEAETEFELSRLDDFFSIIKGTETGVSLRLMSFGALKSLAFELPDDFKEKLDINSLEEISIYYIFVLQKQIPNSSVDLFTPIITNNRTSKMGQIQINLEDLGLESLNDLLPRF